MRVCQRLFFVRAWQGLEEDALWPLHQIVFSPVSPLVNKDGLIRSFDDSFMESF